MGTSEPTPPLKAFFDIPIQFSLPDELATEVDQLARAAKKGEKEWLDIYNGAVRIVETLIERTDREILEIQVQEEGFSAPDASQIKQELVAAPRKEIDKAGNPDTKTALNKAAKEWADRSKRQHEHVLNQCITNGQSQLKLIEEEVIGGLDFKIEPMFWRDFTEFVAKCADQWTDQFTSKGRRPHSQASSRSKARSSLSSRVPATPVVWRAGC